LRKVIENEPTVKVRKIGACWAVSVPQIKELLQQRGVSMGVPYENRKSHLKIEPLEAVNQ